MILIVITMILIVNILFFIFGSARSQQAGTLSQEYHPALTTYLCSESELCEEVLTTITLDANWRWLHSVGGSSNCYTGNSWNSNYCPDPVQCSSNCALEGVDANTYRGTYGISTSGAQLSLQFVTHGPYSINIGSRVYLMKDEFSYQLFYLKNREFSFDVDVSNLPCGINGALYFSEMKEDGSLSSLNKAGAKYGTGYCDAQCPHDIKFINGEANIENWTPTSDNSGNGKYGSCCSELDIWEGNSISTAFTAHPCSTNELQQCEGTDCGDGDERFEGLCDKNGCDFNPYRMGNRSFYGPQLLVDTNKVFTVITQFITEDGSDTGDLVEIKRFYVQGEFTTENSATVYEDFDRFNSITDEYCELQKDLFDEEDVFSAKNGLKAMGESMGRGMVLVMSIWDDTVANCLWLDSNYPIDADPTLPGISRGTCPTTSGSPKEVEANHPNSFVSFGNIKVGPIGSTFPSKSVPNKPLNPITSPNVGEESCGESNIVIEQSFITSWNSGQTTIEQYGITISSTCSVRSLVSLSLKVSNWHPFGFWGLVVISPEIISIPNDVRISATAPFTWSGYQNENGQASFAVETFVFEQ